MGMYKFTAFMSYDVRPSDFWTASIEKQLGEDDISAGSIELEADNFVAGLKVPLLGNALIDRVVVSTWFPDSQPYDPDTVRTISYGIEGDRGYVVSEPVDDTLCLLVRKNVASGRTGKFQLRGVLLVSDLTAASGDWQLDGAVASDFEDNINVMYETICSENNMQLIGLVLLDTLYPATDEDEVQVPIKVYSDNPIVRAVTGAVIVKPTERQENQ